MMFEDFTTYSIISDPDTKLTITQDAIESDQVDRADNIWVAKDYGVDHYEGDFSAEFQHQILSTSDRNSEGNVFAAFSNQVGTFTDINAANGQAIGITAYATGGIILYILSETASGDIDFSIASEPIPLDTPHYFRFRREISSGFSFLDIYSDPAMTVLIDSVSQSLKDVSINYRYAFGVMHSGFPASGLQSYITKDFSISTNQPTATYVVELWEGIDINDLSIQDISFSLIPVITDQTNSILSHLSGNFTQLKSGNFNIKISFIAEFVSSGGGESEFSLDILNGSDIQGAKTFSFSTLSGSGTYKETCHMFAKLNSIIGNTFRVNIQKTKDGALNTINILDIKFFIFTPIPDITELTQVMDFCEQASDPEFSLSGVDEVNYSYDLSRECD